MRVEFSSYQNYCPTDSEWLGELPCGWTAIRLSRLNNKLTNGYVGPTRNILVDDGVRYIQSLHVKSGRILFNEPYFVSEKWSNGHSKSVLRTGDVLIVQTGDIGQVAAVPDEFAGCNCHALIIVAPKEQFIYGSFLAAVLRSHYGFNSLKSVQTGALHPHLNCTHVRDIFVPVPPLPEQQDILAFLDRESFQIDKLLEVRRRQIDCLKEQRTALIQSAVRNGLAANTPMRDAGVEWLGKVPCHWQVKRLKYWVQHKSEQVGSLPPNRRYVALENVESKTGKLIFRDDANEFDSNVKLFNRGDVLFGRLRPYLAKVALPDFDGVCVGELMVLRCRQRQVIPEFLRYRFLAPDFIELVDGSTQGAKMPRASWTFVGNIKLAFPNTDEQQAIVDYIEAETRKIDGLIVKYLREIELLSEYRDSLVYQAVTGRIDVRNFSATAEPAIS